MVSLLKNFFFDFHGQLVVFLVIQYNYVSVWGVLKWSHLISLLVHCQCENICGWCSNTSNIKKGRQWSSTYKIINCIIRCLFYFKYPSQVKYGLCGHFARLRLLQQRFSCVEFDELILTNTWSLTKVFWKVLTEWWVWIRLFRLYFLLRLVPLVG